MTRLSSIPIEARRMGYFISNLWNTISLIENREEAVLFLKELLTPTEIRMLAKRVQVAKMLMEGYKYEDIIPHVRVTAHTITSVNNQLQYKDGGYIKVLEKLIKMEQRKKKQLDKDKRIFYPTFGGASNWAADKLAKKVFTHSKRKSVEKSIE